MDYTGCGAPVASLEDLTPGEMGTAGNWYDIFSYNPAGHAITATIKLCSQDTLAGTCLEKSISLTP